MTSFHRPRTVTEALHLLNGNEGARALAGGASMVAMMNARLITPSAIVSLRDIESLRGIGLDAQDNVRIGAMTRHHQTAEEPLLAGALACVREAARNIANPVVRNMGTMGGSISLADPAADYPPALVAAGARIEIAGASGTRVLPAHEFFVDWYATALQPGELVTAIVLPRKDGKAAYHKLALVAGDFAIASVAVSVSVQGRVSVAIGGCGPKPVASEEANALISRGKIDAAGALLAEAADPVDDVRASAEYRRLVIPRLLAKAVRSIQ